MARRAKVAVVAPVTLIGLALAGCTQPGSSPADTVVILTPSPASCADPRQASTTQTQHVSRQVVSSLVDQDKTTGEIVPWLAESWSVSPDATSFTYRLRGEQYFSDGTPIDAQVVAANFNDIRDKKSAGASLATGYIDGFTEARALDPRTVEVSFAKPNTAFLQASSTVQLGIVGQATLDVEPAARCRGTAVVGSGAYAYRGWESNRSVDLERRLPKVGAPKFIHFEVVPESSVRAASVASGAADIDTQVIPEDVETLTGGDANVLGATNPGLPLVLQPNFSRSAFSNPEVRTALSLAIDRQEIIDTALTPEFKPALGPLSSTTPAAIATGSPTADRNAAIKVLEDSGWTVGPDGRRYREGQPLSFGIMFSPEFAQTSTVLQIIQYQAKQVGIEVRLEQETNATFLARRAQQDFDAVLYNVTRADPDILRQRVAFDQAKWTARPFDDNLDPLLVEQRKIADPRARSAVVEKIQRTIAAKSLLVPILEFSQVVAANKRVRGLSFDAPGTLRLDGLELNTP